MGLGELPRLTVTAVDGEHCVGRFEASKWIGEGWDGFIVHREKKMCIPGFFRDVNLETRTCAFHPEDTTTLSILRSGHSYPFIDGYWGQRAELALDARRVWERREFEKGDALRYPAPGGGFLLTKNTPDAPPGGELIRAAWDHEHCAICWQKISGEDQPVGYLSAPESWVCEECYVNYVEPRSLAFIPLGASESS
jgi:hypothetical protein